MPALACSSMVFVPGTPFYRPGQSQAQTVCGGASGDLTAEDKLAVQPPVRPSRILTFTKNCSRISSNDQMNNAPPASQLCLLSSLPSKEAGDKVRFLGW